MNEKSLSKLRTGRVHECLAGLCLLHSFVSEYTRNDQAGMERWSHREQRGSACHSSRLEVSLPTQFAGSRRRDFKTPPEYHTAAVAIRRFRSTLASPQRETGAPHARRPSEFALLGRLDFNQSTECRFPGTDLSGRTCFSFFFYHNVFFFLFFQLSTATEAAALLLPCLWESNLALQSFLRRSSLIVSCFHFCNLGRQISDMRRMELSRKTPSPPPIPQPLYVPLSNWKTCNP